MSDTNLIQVIFGSKSNPRQVEIVRSIFRSLPSANKSFIKLLHDKTLNTDIQVVALVQTFTGMNAIKYLENYASTIMMAHTDRKAAPERKEYWERPQKEYRLRTDIGAPAAQMSFGAPVHGPGYQYQEKHYLPSKEIHVPHMEVRQEQQRLRTVLDDRTRVGSIVQ